MLVVGRNKEATIRHTDQVLSPRNLRNKKVIEVKSGEYEFLDEIPVRETNNKVIIFSFTNKYKNNNFGELQLFSFIKVLLNVKVVI